MRMHNVRRALLVLLPLLLLLATGRAALAADPADLQLQAPQEATLGEQVTVTAVLRDASGTPIVGAPVILWSPAQFLSTGGAVQLGKVATNARGEATFRYEARTEESVVLNASFSGDSRYSAAQASAQMAVQGSAQLYQSSAGVRVPGVSVWLLVGLLGGVWGTYLAVMVLLTLIAREGAKAPSRAGGQHG
ncbi:MAG: Ig-like domain-containing protein [Chloroflexi bacterium]|nr:Ig-like domain-containing protein [Chloroflexota bacterium]